MNTQRSTRRAQGALGTRADSWFGGCAAVALLAALLLAACGDDDGVSPAASVSPIYTGSCELLDCGEHGKCRERTGALPYCECEPGHLGEACELCGDGHHLDALDRCVPDRSCNGEAVDPCLPYGSCDDSDGALRCQCLEGYLGARCQLCASGYARSPEGDCLRALLTPDGPATHAPLTGCGDGACNGHGDCSEATGSAQCSCYPAYTGLRCELCAQSFTRDGERCVPVHATPTDRCVSREAFDETEGFPVNPNTCISRARVTSDGLTLTSLGGSGTAWLCAAAQSYGLLSEHVMLEAGTTAPAELVFDEPIDQLAFEYGARFYGDGPTLALELAADGEVVDTLEVARGEHGVLEYDFADPIERFTLRSLGATLEEIGLDVIELRRSACAEEGDER